MILELLLGDSLATRGAGRSLTDPWLGRWFNGGRASAAGATVTEDKALSLSAVFAAVNLLSRVHGSLPLHVYQQDGQKKEKAVKHPVYAKLHHRPNPEMTASVFRRCLEWSRLLFGKACAEIQYDGRGEVAALWPVEGWRVRPERYESGELYYRVDNKRNVNPKDMLYVPLVSEDGVCGRSFLDYACESLGLAITAQEFAARFFGNGARPGGLLEHPGNPSPESRKELRESWNAEHQGGANASKLGVLWNGWKFNRDAGTIAPDEAQLLETRRFSTEEVARWLNVQPHLIAELSRATFSNIEEQGINFVTYSLGPVLVEYEQEYDVKLLDPPDLFSKHNLGALLRGNMAARASYYTSLFGIGVMSVNDILELEDRNPTEGGDQHFVPMNMAPLVEDDAPLVEPAGEATDPAATSAPANNSKDAAASGDIQATALNGAQIMALLEVARQQTADQISKEASRALLQAAFPLIPAELVSKIVDELDKFEPAELPPPPSPSGPPAMRALLAAVLDRMVTLESNAVRRAAAKPGRFLAKLDEFYPAHAYRMAEALAPVLAACTPGAQAAHIAGEWCRVSREELLEVSGNATAAGLVAAVDKCLLSWGTRREELIQATLKEDDHGNAS